MECSIRDCYFYILIGFFGAIALFLVGYLIVYIYITYVTKKYYATDLIQSREQRLKDAQQKYEDLLRKTL